ncbi:hypothetical protein A9Q81_02370 [Gammaproteobacteria bacterium 42_54_T18]|nr:hypothetical protein A9Q81_02370 [Gammaproteobacteria bacterium 42_54_T18]
MMFTVTPRPQSGFTLIELVITIVVISIALAAMLGAFSGAMSHSADPLWRNKTIKLAQLYLDEILSKRFDENSPVGGVPANASTSCTSIGADGVETRATYDDVDDFHNTTNSVPVGASGTLDTSYDNYLIAVEVTCDDAGGAVNSSGSDIHAKRIKVSVTPPGQSTMVFYAYKGNY